MSRVVLVTGASSGIGAATAELLAARGDTVIGVARSAEGLARLAERAPTVTTVAADVLDHEAMAGVVDDVVARHGRLDGVVHAAQVMAYGRIEDVPRETYERVVDTATHGTANVLRPALAQMRRQERGVLVVVNSLLGQVATPGMGAYDVGKWGQLGLIRVLQLEVRNDPHIHVCTLSPGAINTPIYDQAANYAGRGGYPPPPVLKVERAARKAARLLDHPRRHVNVGPVNRITQAGFLLLPPVYERLVGPLVVRFVFRGRPTGPNDGNVFAPVPEGERPDGRWTTTGRVRP